MGNKHNISEAKQNYSSFITAFKWGATAVGIVTAIVVLVIASGA